MQPPHSEPQFPSPIIRRSLDERGSAVAERTCIITWVALLAACATATLAPAADKPIDTAAWQEVVPISSVMADSPGDVRRPVRVRGVVTWRRGAGMVVQDESAGIWIEVTDARRIGLWQAEDDPPTEICVGTEVEIDGWSNRGGYAPNILPARMRVIGVHTLPPPRPYDRERFFQGVDDCLRVTVRGVVQGYRDDSDRWIVLVSEGTRRFTVAIEKSQLVSPPETFVDGVIRATGVATAQFNTRGQFLAPRVNVTDRHGLVVEQPPGGPPFESPRVSLRAIAGYRPQRADGHRLCTQGVVTYAVPGRFLYLQENCLGVRVETTSQERYEPGDVVEVAGFIDSVGYVASLVEAMVRKVAREASPEPIPIHPAAIAQINAVAAARFVLADPGDYYGCLVTFPARVIDVQTTNGGGEVMLDADDTGVAAAANVLVFAGLQWLEPGSDVKVTGIVQPEPMADKEWTKEWQSADGRRMQILLRSTSDIELVRPPSWWTPRRLAASLAAVASLAAFVAGWAVLLRRQVVRQLSLIESQLQIEAASEERHRIAREFHDTLEQDLAGIALRMDAAAGRTQDERSRAEFEQQRALFEKLREETHDFLWDLRDPQRNDGSLQASLAAQVAYQRSLTSVPITLHLETDVPRRVPSMVQYHLLRIAREAVSNALEHADPSRIDLWLRGGDAGIVLEVVDDGSGFDVASGERLDGHFGMRGMRERSRRIGGEIAIDSRPGAGTTVRVQVPSGDLPNP
jgi:signal transduction histidine kinase